ncbi:MAG: TolC family protein [Bacteroidetes bacterium]|nr:TolC family protein [Bacteroidota bacterium]
MNRIIALLMFIFWGSAAVSQESITIEICLVKALANHPLSKQNEFLPASHVLRIANLNKNYLPQMNLNGQAHYQSAVTQVPIHVPGINIPAVSKDQYNLYVDVSQVIYDGSATGRQKDVEDINLKIDQQNLDIELFRLKDRVNQIYFVIMLLKQKTDILDLHKATLFSKLIDVESKVKNGTLLSSNQDILQAEIIKAEQAISENKISLVANIGMLNELTGLSLNESTVLLLPEVTIDLVSYTNNRPEFSLFTLQQEKITASKKLTGTSLMPRLSAFGQAGYGRPGFDMLKDEFDDYYMVGARLNWKFWDWNKTKKDKAILDLQNDILLTQKETFDKNVRIDLQNKIAEIRKTEEMISRDKELIELREKISKSVSSQLDNGIITSSQYLTEINAEAGARLDLETHKIQLVKAKFDYQTALGNL